MTEPARARSALNLRTALATFGVLSCSGLAVLAGARRATWLVVVLGLLALVGVVDLVVIARRRRREPGQHRTLFE